MDTKEIVQKLLQEMVVPDLGKIRDENSKILAILELTNKRLDDVNTQLADQSRRIDEVRSELSQRIDETNKRIDVLHSELSRKIDDARSELIETNNETNNRLYDIHSDLIKRIDANNARIDLFFQNSASKADQGRLEKRLTKIEDEVNSLKQKLAA